MLGFILCALGFHAWRLRKNGDATERVCMRPGCDKKEKLYKYRDGTVELWNHKRIHERHSNFRKAIKE